jgi:hypothetical protein
MLRNPADRMYSAFYYYGHYGTRYGSHPEGFHTYAQAMVDSFKECVQAPGMSNRCVGVYRQGRSASDLASEARWQCGSRRSELD